LPFGSSERAGQETSYDPMPDDSMVTLPVPSVSEPSQCVLAVRVVAIYISSIVRMVVCCTIAGARPRLLPG
jgi:hypothetical protein